MSKRGCIVCETQLEYRLCDITETRVKFDFFRLG